MKAIIIGGGIAGPVTAMALQRAGIEAVVHEAHDGPATSRGLFLGLGVNGMRILEDLGVLDSVIDSGAIPTPTLTFWSGTGKRLGAVSNGRLPSGVPSVTIMRGELQRALTDAARARGIEVRYGKRFVAYEQTGGGVTARFEDGSVAEGDILIGADGIHSPVRRLMSPEAPEPSYVGLVNLGGVARDTGLAPTRARCTWSGGSAPSSATPCSRGATRGGSRTSGYGRSPGGGSWTRSRRRTGSGASATCTRKTRRTSWR